MKVNLHIECLVLDGLPLGNRDAALVEEAVRAQLTQLFMQDEWRGRSLASAAVPGVQGAAVHVPASQNPVLLGSTIAQSVYGAIAR